MGCGRTGGCGSEAWTLTLVLTRDAGRGIAKLEQQSLAVVETEVDTDTELDTESETEAKTELLPNFDGERRRNRWCAEQLQDKWLWCMCCSDR